MAAPEAPGELPGRLTGRVLIAGVSTRAAAESAARARFVVTAIDAFGDLDQHAAVRCLSVRRDFGEPFSAHAAARAVRRIECDAVVYGSNFENHPSAVSVLAAGRTLWGNPPAVLRNVRDPLLVMQALRRHGCAAPDMHFTHHEHPAHDGSPMSSFSRTSRSQQDENVRRKPNATPGNHRRWLLKPLASGGGHRVRLWRPNSLLPRGCYLQELVAGTPGSIAFVAAGGRAVPLGVFHQLVGDSAFGASGYRYCGNILVAADAASDAVLVDRACTLARAVAEEFDVVGVNGIDFVARDGLPYGIEVNPRWCASMELIERAYGLSVFGAHAAACANGVLPAFDLVRARRGATAAGKAVVFARRDVTVGDTRGWLSDASVRDVPHRGERIPAGQPVCTVFAAGRDAVACRAALVRRAERVYAELDVWEGGSA